MRLSPRTYSTRDAATAAWVRAGRAAGTVKSLGGGWRRVAWLRRPIQGLDVLARELERRGLLRIVPAADSDTRPGIWRWELVPPRAQAEVYQLPTGWYWIDVPARTVAHGPFVTAPDAQADADRVTAAWGTR
jgi:hypothetical protein